jgi:hypothetical protein
MDINYNDLPRRFVCGWTENARGHAGTTASISFITEKKKNQGLSRIEAVWRQYD